MNRIFIIAAILFLLGCKTDPIEKTVPVITINTPSNNQHFVVGDIIHVTGTVTHNLPLTEIAVHMTDLSNDMEFFHNHFSVANTTTFNFDAQYPIPNNIKTSFEVEIEASDKDGNTANKTILVTIN